jgi:hypothetical protein
MKSILTHYLILIFICAFNVYNVFSSDSIASNLRKNAVYYEIFGNGLWVGSLNYDRIIPISPNTGMVVRGGLSFYDKFFPLAEINFLFGREKRYLETGGGYTGFHEGELVFLRLGYRYVGYKGFLFRAAPIFSVNQKFLWFGLSFGYSF